MDKLTITKLFGNQARTILEDGKKYLVVPGVPVQEQVMNTYLVEGTDIEKSLLSWEGTPLSIRHAKQNNGSVQVDNPDVPIIGELRNPKWDKYTKRMLADYWFDESEAERIMDGQLITGAIRNGQILETSTAYWADEDEISGAFNGKSYTTVHRNLCPDHIAVFPPHSEIGACSIQDGCGVNRNSKHGELSLDQESQIVRQSFYNKFNSGDKQAEPNNGYVREVYPSYVIIDIFGVLYKAGYKRDESGEAVFDEKADWEKVKVEYMQANHLFQHGAKHPWHKGRPGEKGGSTSTAAGKAKDATAKADRATKLAMESRTPEAYKTARDYHVRAAKANFEAYQDVKGENPDAAESFKKAVMEHEGTAQILERRMKPKENSLQYNGLFINLTGNLPAGGKAIWEKVYKANKKKYGEERAAKIAWGAVEKAGWGKDKEGKWVHKNNSDVPLYVDGHLPTAMLINYSFNKGSRTQAEIESAREHIKSKGITKPVWVQCNGSIKIFDGNHRVQIADELGIEQIPVRVVDGELKDMDPEAVYRKWLHEQDQGYLG